MVKIKTSPRHAPFAALSPTQIPPRPLQSLRLLAEHAQLEVITDLCEVITARDDFTRDL
jgi:hypothetical protein